MKSFVSEDTKALRKSTRIVAVIAGVVLIVLGTFLHSFYSILVGAILLLSIILCKTIEINEEGLVVTYDMIVFSHREVWTFEEIKEIHKEVSPDGNKMALHVMKDVMSRRLLYPMDEVEDVIAFVLEQNPKIHVSFVNNK